MIDTLEAAQPPLRPQRAAEAEGSQPAPAGSNLGERPSETEGVQPDAVRPQPDRDLARSGQAERPAEPPPCGRSCLWGLHEFDAIVDPQSDFFQCFSECLFDVVVGAFSARLRDDFPAVLGNESLAASTRHILVAATLLLDGS